MGDDGIEPQQCETQSLCRTVVQLRADPLEETFVAGCPFGGGPANPLSPGSGVNPGFQLEGGPYLRSGSSGASSDRRQTT